MTARQWQVSFMPLGKGNLICLKPQRSTFADARTRNHSSLPISHSAPQYNQLGIEPYHAEMRLGRSGKFQTSLLSHGNKLHH